MAVDHLGPNQAADAPTPEFHHIPCRRSLKERRQVALPSHFTVIVCMIFPHLDQRGSATYTLNWNKCFILTGALRLGSRESRMIAEGLLWFDDDPHRPFSAKMAEAARRFSERTGWIPTACEAHPQTLAQRAVTPRPSGRGHTRAKTAPEEAEPGAPKLVVTPNPAMRPNYLLVGVEVGKTPRPVRRERASRPAAPRRAASSAPRLSA